MSKLIWHEVGKKLYETGVDKGVLFPMKDDGTYDKGVAWQGLTNVAEKPSGAEPTTIFADNEEYLNLYSKEKFAASIQAYMSPEEFDECDGSKEIVKGVSIGQQERRGFGFAYRSKIGNDVKSDAYGYKIHLIYGCKAAPSERSRNTVNDSPEAMQLSWELSTTPVEIAGFRPTAHIIIDSTKVDASKLKAFEDKLYGTETLEPSMPTPSEIVTLLGMQG